MQMQEEANVSLMSKQNGDIIDGTRPGNFVCLQEYVIPALAVFQKANRPVRAFLNIFFHVFVED